MQKLEASVRRRVHVLYHVLWSSVSDIESRARYLRDLNSSTSIYHILTTTHPASMASNPPTTENAEPAPAAPATAQPETDTGYAPLVDPRLPTQKDTSLKDFLNKMDDYAPIVRGSSVFLQAPRLAN